MIRRLQQALPNVRTVRLWHTPEQSHAEQPIWECEDRVGMLGSACRRFAPSRWE